MGKIKIAIFAIAAVGFTTLAILIIPEGKVVREIKSLCGIVDPNATELAVAYHVVITRQLDYLLGDGYDNEDKLLRNEVKEKKLWLWAADLPDSEIRKIYLRELVEYQNKIDAERATGKEKLRAQKEQSKRIDDLADCLLQPPSVN